MKTNKPRSILLSPQQVTKNPLILNYFFDILVKLEKLEYRAKVNLFQ